MLYKNFGFNIYSDIELPFSPNDNVNEKIDIHILKIMNKPKLTAPIQEYSVTVNSSDQLICKLMEHSKTLTMDYINHVCFQYLNQDGTYYFYYYCYEEYSRDAMGRLIGRFGMAYLLTWMGMTVLHGSAVTNNKQAICFVADSGVGKSSMAGLFVANGWRLMADELLVLKSEGKRTILLPSSPYLQLSDESLHKTALSNYPYQSIVIQLNSLDSEDVEITNRVDLHSASSFESYDCSKIYILNRGYNDDVTFLKYEKIDTFINLIHYLYTPIIFPCMRKNLLALINNIVLERAVFSDCFTQFEDIKKHIDET